MRHLSFFLRQALASAMHNRQRTLFVLFCIAVGVAAVVSLRTVGLMMGEGLTHDLQADNRADIVVGPPIVDERISSAEYDEDLVERGGEFSSTSFTEAGLERVARWASEQGVGMQRAVRHLRPMPIFPVRQEGPESASVLAFFVEPERYPFYGELAFVEPEGITLSRALSEPGGIVISDRLAETLEVGVGDQLHLRGPEPFEVRAILDNAAEARMREMQAVVLPWVLLAYESAETTFGLRADTLYLRVPEDRDVSEVGKAFEGAFIGTRLSTTDDLQERNSEITGTLTRLITTLGLVSLLIGGIGIVNTMLVVVGRRTLEIGVLKTIGLQGPQITLMFLIEALLLGIVGSLLGVVLGVGMVAGLQGIAESVVAQPLEFAVYPEALVMGLVTGVLVTIVFGFLPTLAAGRVRPNVVLQPDQQIPPKASAWRSLLIIVALTAVVGLMVGQILERALMGFALTYAVVAGMGILTWIFRLVVVLFGKLPSFGSTYFKLTQRAVNSHPGRAASTILALVVGMFALSSILLMTGALLNVINDVMEERLGGDVIVVPDSAEASARAEAKLAELGGVESVKHQVVWTADVAAIDGDNDIETLEKQAYEVGKADSEHGVAEDEAKDGEPEEDDKEFDRTRFFLRDFFGEFSISLASDDSTEYEIGEGVDVEPDDGAWIVLRPNDATEWLGLGVGSRLTLQFEGGEERTVTVAGLIDVPEDDGFEVNVGMETRAVASDDVVPASVIPRPTPFVIDVDDERMGETIRELSAEPGLFAVPVSLVNQLLTGLFEKLIALPMVIAVLALFAGGVIIANTVSLAVLERRRQIGIMKAVGLHSRQVLYLLLLESGLVGLLGGIIGTGVGAAMILFMGVLSESPGSFPVLTLVGLVALAVAIAIAATLLTAWGASREKPLVVLRYE